MDEYSPASISAFGSGCRRARIADFGGTAFPGLPADFGKFVAEETEKSGKVIRAANTKLD
jgi:hypothetical protein